MKLVLLSQDLMIGARVEGAARQHGLTTVTVSDQQAALDAMSDPDCRLLFVDLQLSGLDVSVVAEAARNGREVSLPIVACGPHVHEARLAAAREAGCDAVVTRGQFDREAADIVGRLIGQ